MPSANHQFRNQLLFIGFCFGMVILSMLFVLNLLVVGRNETLRNREVGKVNQFYTRVVACMASVSPIKRTPDYVKSCYDRAASETGVNAERYGDGI